MLNSLKEEEEGEEKINFEKPQSWARGRVAQKCDFILGDSRRSL